MVFNDSNSSSSSSTSSVSSGYGVNTYSDSTTMEVGDYLTFQSHVKSIISTQKPGTTELFMSSWEPLTLKVYDSNYSKFFSFCLKNSLNPSSITLVVFQDYLTYLFKLKPPLAYSTINSHRSMLNQLLFLKNQTDVAHDPFITRTMTGIHKLLLSYAKYNEIWDANLARRGFNVSLILFSTIKRSVSLFLRVDEAVMPSGVPNGATDGNENTFFELITIWGRLCAPIQCSSLRRLGPSPIPNHPY
ncbi:hypothetical protein ACTFIU_005339 [Dictyostelium citrinum]